MALQEYRTVLWRTRVAPRPASSWRTSRYAVLVLPLLAFLAACDGDSLKPERPAADQLYWDIALNHRAVVLSTTAPYDKLTLVVTPRNAAGEPLTGAPPARYTSRDENTVVVFDGGVLQAVEAGVQPVWVVATLTWGKLTYSDSVYVKVVDDPAPPVLASFSIHPIPPDSAKVAATWGVAPVLPVRAADTAGAAMAGLIARFRSSDTKIAAVDATTGRVSGWLPGSVMIDASVTAFGVTKADTVRYRIGWPLMLGFPASRIAPGEASPVVHPFDATLGVGAIVFWLAQGPDRVPTDIVFDDADVPNVQAAAVTTLLDPATLGGFCSSLQADCNSGGNFVIPADGEIAGEVRVLAVPGIYEFRSEALGVSGRITVVDER